MVKTATQCLEAYIKARKWTSSTAFAREYYACGQVHLTAIVIHRKICKSRITFLQMREYIENISYLFDQYSEYSEITVSGCSRSSVYRCGSFLNIAPSDPAGVFKSELTMTEPSACFCKTVLKSDEL